MADEKPAIDVKPSASTVASSVGAMAAVILILILTACGVKVDPASAVTIGGGMAALAGWFFNGGRASDTQQETKQ